MGDTLSGVGRAARVRWTREEDLRLERMLKDGFTHKEAAAALGRSQGSIFGRQEHLRDWPLTPPPPPKTKRQCLCCKQPFMSEGIHNRMCINCLRKDPPGAQFLSNSRGFQRSPRRPE